MFLETVPPHLSQGLDDLPPRLTWRLGSTTATYTPTCHCDYMLSLKKQQQQQQQLQRKKQNKQLICHAYSWYVIFDNLWQKAIAVYNTPNLFELRDKLSQNCRCFLLHFFFSPDLRMWCECLIYFYLALFNSLSFSVFFSIFSNDNIFAIRCKWQISKSCLFFFSEH